MKGYLFQKSQPIILNNLSLNYFFVESTTTVFLVESTTVLLVSAAILEESTVTVVVESTVLVESTEVAVVEAPPQAVRAVATTKTKSTFFMFLF
jgi:hypothetical protein